MLQAWTKKVVSKDDWEKKLAAVKVAKEDMNRLVMNFLVTEVSYRHLSTLLYLLSSCYVIRAAALSLENELPPPLLQQGYVEAAESFLKESNTKSGVDLAAITDRMEIRKAVQSGDIQDAIERVNDLNPEVAFFVHTACSTAIYHVCITRLSHHKIACNVGMACRFWRSSTSCPFTCSSSVSLNSLDRARRKRPWNMPKST